MCQDFERWLWYWTGIPPQIHYFWPLSQTDHQMAAQYSSEIHLHQKRLKESQLVNKRIILLQLISFSVTRINLTPLGCWSTAPPPQKKKRASLTVHYHLHRVCAPGWRDALWGKVSCLTSTLSLHWHKNLPTTNSATLSTNYPTDQLTLINSLVYQSYWQVDNDKLIRSVGELTTLKGVYELTNSVCKLVVGELTCQQSDRLQPKKTTQLLNCGRPWSNEAMYWQPLTKSNRRIILVILFIIYHTIQGKKLLLCTCKITPSRSCPSKLIRSFSSRRSFASSIPNKAVLLCTDFNIL